jgi:hypothetical protein
MEIAIIESEQLHGVIRASAVTARNRHGRPSGFAARLLKLLSATPRKRLTYHRQGPQGLQHRRVDVEQGSVSKRRL